MYCINLYYQRYHYQYHWTYNELSPLTWGQLAFLFYCHLEKETTLDFSGCHVFGIYDPYEGGVYSVDEIIYFPSYASRRLLNWEEVESGKRKKYFLLLQGPIHRLMLSPFPTIFYSLILKYLLGISPPSTSSSILKDKEMKDGVACIARLMRTNTFIKRLLMNDQFWNQLDFPFSLEPTKVDGIGIELSMNWEGKGSAGTEDEYWDFYQEENGIQRIISYKFRKTAKKLSKVRLLYGHIPLSLSNSFSPNISPSRSFRSTTTFWNSVISSILPFFRSNDIRDQYQHSIQIINFKSSSPFALSTNLNDYMKVFMKKMHYLIPTSATNYHFTNRENSSTTDLLSVVPAVPTSTTSPNSSITPTSLSRFGIIHPLFYPYSRLVDLESSPRDCRGRRSLPDDPCTRVESIRIKCSQRSMTRESTEENTKSETSLSPLRDYEFIYRRVGDRRITFLQYDYHPEAFATNERDFYYYTPPHSFTSHHTTNTLFSRRVSSSTLSTSTSFQRQLSDRSEITTTFTQTLWQYLSEKAMGYILYLEYTSLASFEQQKVSLSEYCHTFLFNEYRCYTSNPFPHPILILIGIPWQSYSMSLIDTFPLVIQNDPTLLNQRLQQELTQLIVNTQKWFHQQFQYYYPNYLIHPINIDLPENAMNHGFLESINWLCREIIRKISLQYS